jgi:hypothetical protein
LLAPLIVASFVFMGLKLTPVYLDHNTIVTVMEKMSQKNDLAHQHDAKMSDFMRERLKSMDTREVDLAEHLKIARGKVGAGLVSHYEVVIDLFGKLGLTAAFENKVSLRE